MAVTMHHISTGAISRYFWIAHIAVFLLHCARASQDGTDSQVNSPRRFNVVRAMFVSCITVTTVFATICSQHYSTKIATKYKSLTQRSTNVSIGMQTRQATLATYPRSGTSWVREMLRTASGVSTKMTTTKDELAWILPQLIKTSKCTDDDPSCTDEQILFYLQNNSLMVPYGTGSLDKLNSMHGLKDPATALQHTTNTRLCAQVAQTRPQPNATTHDFLQWVYRVGYDMPWRLLIKSHFPEVRGKGDSGDRLTRVCDRRVHLVRNPFDNIMSRYHGNMNIFETKRRTEYSVFMQERKRHVYDGKSSNKFAHFLKETLESYRAYHNHWLQERRRNPGAQVFYVRYESLCHNTSTILPKLLAFLGYPAHKKDVACVLATYPCTSALSGAKLPEHQALYSADELALIAKETSGIMSTFGYSLDLQRRELFLVEPKINMTNG